MFRKVWTEVKSAVAVAPIGTQDLALARPLGQWVLVTWLQTIEPSWSWWLSGFTDAHHPGLWFLSLP